MRRMILESKVALTAAGIFFTTALFEEARLRAQATLPQVSVLAFLTENLSRDQEIALCDAF